MRRLNTKLHDQNKGKNRIPMLWVDPAFEWYQDVMLFRELIFLFLSGTNGKKEHLAVV